MTTTLTSSPGSTFTRALRGEAIKATSTHTLAISLIATAIVALLTVAAMSSMALAFASADEAPLADAWGAYGLVLTAIPILLVWAAHVFFGEVTNGVLRATFLAVPQRGTVFLAKGVLAAAVGVAAVVLLVPACHAVYAVIIGQPSALGYVITPAGLWAGARLAFVVACWSFIAVSIAALTRNLALSVGIILVVYLFLEAYLVDIPGAPWLAYVLPFASGKAVVPELSDVSLPGAGWAALGQLTTTAALVAAAWWATVRRDVK
ncbi:MAG: hypothetical protein L0G22_01105 [Propionibacteriaceae bacterium]|nr:hypothetical protein [Propionibacteriaceae bacterium]